MQGWKGLWCHGRRHPIETAISLIVICLILWALWATGSWVVQAADWSVVGSNLPLYLSGSYPEDERWRPVTWVSLLAMLTLLTLLRPGRGARVRWLELCLPWGWIAMIPLGLGLLGGGVALNAVPSRDWGGLSLSLLLTACSAALALPLGVLLALGRTSDLPVIRHSSRLYIDLMRAVPLIAVLFFGQLLIPLFLPVELEINRVLRAVMNSPTPKRVPRAQRLSLGHSSTRNSPSRDVISPSITTNPFAGPTPLAPAASSITPFTSNNTPANRVRLISLSMGSTRTQTAAPQ